MKNCLTIFMHIPKTGGVTLHDVLNRTYGRKNMLEIPNRKARFREEAMKRAAGNKPLLARGHLDVLEAIDIPNTFLFTFLREPISRVISHYYYLKELPSARHFQTLNQQGMSIESFYAMKEKKDIDNCLVRYVGGCFDAEFGEIGQAHFEKAMHNLQHKIHFFGMQDHYDESLILLARELDWPLPVYRKKNVTKKKEAVSEQTKAFLREANKWDILLYKNAQEMFSEKLRSMTDKDKKRLSRLRLLNKFASAIPLP